MTRPAELTADELQLEALGHKGELKRQFSFLSLLGLAFAILNSWLVFPIHLIHLRSLIECLGLLSPLRSPWPSPAAVPHPSSGAWSLLDSATSASPHRWLSSCPPIPRLEVSVEKNLAPKSITDRFRSIPLGCSDCLEKICSCP